MKKVFSILGALLLSLSMYAAMNVNKIEPPFWLIPERAKSGASADGVW